MIVDGCPEEFLHPIETIRDVENVTKCSNLCDPTADFPFCKSFFFDSLTHECVLYNDPLEDYLGSCQILGGGTDTVENCLKDNESYPNICKVSNPGVNTLDLIY